MQLLALSTAATILISGAAFAQPVSKKSESSDRKTQHFMFRLGGARLGVEAIPISKEVRRMLGAPDDAGVLVNRVEPDSPAGKAGLKAGDIIVEVDGQKIDDVPDIREALSEKQDGANAQVVVIRDKARQTLTASIKGEQWLSRGFGPGFDDRIFASESYGPKLREQLKNLSERVEELERKFEKFRSK